MFFSRLRPSKLSVLTFYNKRGYYTVKRKVVKDESYIARQIYQKIKVKGPLTVADYMKEVLTNPMAGYYMQKDMIGEGGDFVTSPEITQMFGEMIAVWFLNEWQKMGSPKPLQIIELGPGKGTLCNDILKVFSHFKALHKTSLHLVEVSPVLSDLQAKRLCLTTSLCDPNAIVYRKGITTHGIPVYWYKQLCDVPIGFNLIVAHEFFDALPIHKFHKTYGGYREVLIDIESTKDNSGDPKFRYVLARQDTPMSKVLLKHNETRDHVEISPESLVIYKEICERIKSSGGGALICDYGHDGTGTDTFRAFKKHKQVDPLGMPGTADLTADVDFSLLKQVAKEVDGVILLGPTTQRDFLLKTGLEFRLKTLTENMKDKSKAENLLECYKFLTDRDKMGERFKFCAVFPDTMWKIFERCPVVGFS